LSDLGSDVFDDVVAALGAADMVGSSKDWAEAFARERAVELVDTTSVRNSDTPESIVASTRSLLRLKIKEAITGREHSVGCYLNIGKTERTGNMLPGA